MIPLHDDNPTSIRPVVTIVLIALCVVIFLWQFSLGQQGFQKSVFAFGVIPAVLFDNARLPAEINLIPAELTVISSMFLHGGWMHLIGNMLYLWIFGNNIEDVMGHRRYIVFYLLCGVAAVMAQAVAHPSAKIPMVGASGAISGVLGAYLLLFPRARIYVLVPVFVFFYTVYLPAIIVLGFWFLLQLLNSGAATAGEGGTAWFAHIGGFVAGMALIPFFKHRHVRFFNPPHPHGRRR